MGECKEMRLADIDIEECNEWWGLEDLRESSSSLYAFLRMGSSDDAETGTTQTVANQIGSVLRLAAVNGSHIRLWSGEVQVSAPILFLEYVCILWLDTYYYSGLVLFSSFEGLDVGWQSTFSSVEYRLFE